MNELCRMKDMCCLSLNEINFLEAGDLLEMKFQKDVELNSGRILRINFWNILTQFDRKQASSKLLLCIISSTFLGRKLSFFELLNILT